MSISEEINKEITYAISLRREFHKHPETKYTEYWTSNRIAEELDKIKKTASELVYTRNWGGGTGIIAYLPATESYTGPCIALRADIDALAVTEDTGADYCSQIPGKSHACGHDGHITCLLTTIRVLCKFARKYPVKFFFQPAEETGMGSDLLVKEGCLLGQDEKQDMKLIGPRVCSVFGLHGWPQLKVGEIGFREGPMMASIDVFRIIVQGEHAHGACPHLAKDPIVCAAQIIMALQTLVSRNLDPLDSAVCSVGRVTSGTECNIIPGSAELHGTLRSLRDGTRSKLRKRLVEIAEHTALAMGMTATVEWSLQTPVLNNDVGATQSLLKAISAVPDSTDLVLQRMPVPSMASEDFAVYSTQVPCCFFWLGTCPKHQDTYYSLHHPKYDFTDTAIHYGVYALSAVALAVDPRTVTK